MGSLVVRRGGGGDVVSYGVDCPLELVAKTGDVVVVESDGRRFNVISQLPAPTYAAIGHLSVEVDAAPPTMGSQS
jgi:hypothetical protein